MRPTAIATLGAALVLAPALRAQAARNFELVRVAEGVHVAVQRDPLADPIDGNTTVIVNDSDVVVIDTKITPATAQAVVEAIRRLTPKPVRYVVNTHFHSDHHYGNAVFRQAWPGAEFVGHENTLADMLTLDNDSIRHSNRGRYPKLIEDRRRWLAAGRRDDGTALTPELRQLYERQVEAFTWVGPELGRVRLVPPTLTVRDALVLRRGERTIEIRAEGKDLEATRAAVKLHDLKRGFAGDDWRRQRAFDAFFAAPAVERAWREARGELTAR